MRVLAVGEVEHLLERGDEVVGEVLLALGEPARDRGVVARGRAERLGRERLARLRRKQTAGLLQLLGHGVVALRPHHHAHERVVLGGRPDQGRPADVDVLDHLLLGDTTARRRALERVEVHADQVDRRDAVLGERLAVLLVRAHREQARR